jgi:hypothetical protein
VSSEHRTTVRRHGLVLGAGPASALRRRGQRGGGRQGSHGAGSSGPVASRQRGWRAQNRPVGSGSGRGVSGRGRGRARPRERRKRGNLCEKGKPGGDGAAKMPSPGDLSRGVPRGTTTPHQCWHTKTDFFLLRAQDVIPVSRLQQI